MTSQIRVAVIGAGMAGTAHASAFARSASLYDPVLPDIELVAIADINGNAAAKVAARFGYGRYENSWEAIAAAPDIDAVSVVVANSLHRPIVEALLAAGKHVLCEKPLAGTGADARAMADAASGASAIARLGFTFRRTPAIAAIRKLVDSGQLGKVLHISGRYWTDYGADPQAPMSWRYKGEAGSGVLSDIGSHIADVAEFVGGRALSLQGGRLSTVISQRPLPLGAVTGHDHTAVSDVFEDVENEDYAAFSLELPQGSASIEVSRVARGHANTLTFEVFCENGAARFDQRSTGQFELFDNTADAANNGYRRVLLGPQHPYVAGGLAMDAPSVGLGVNDSFTFQARAFLEEVAGLPEKDSLPRRASFGEGVHNMEILQAAVESAAAHGKRIELT